MPLDGTKIRVCVECGADISHQRWDALTCSSRCNTRRQDKKKHQQIVDQRKGRLCLVCRSDISSLNGCAFTCKGECRETYYLQVHSSYSKNNRQTINLKQRQRHAAKRESEAGCSRPAQCEVCGSTKTLHYDHCHLFGHFRGWLCGPCNRVLGLVKDDPTILRKLAVYLDERDKP